MNRNRPYLNRFVKQKQLELTDTYHDLNMRDIKPITSRLMQHAEAFTINNSKREMIKEVRDIQIQRENKLLLSKIEKVMVTKGNYSVHRTKSVHTKANKSLNDFVRRKQMESIEQENKRFLLRLQSRKPTVDTFKLRKDWQQNKSVIKRMANYQFNVTHFKNSRDSKIRSFTSDRLFRSKIQNTKVNKLRMIDGQRMLIKVEFVDGILKIVGDCRDHKDLKVIEIPREEALMFIQKDCQGRMQKLLDKLKYDRSTQTLYLISESIEEERINPESMRRQSIKHQYETLPIKPVSTIEYSPKVSPAQEQHYQTIALTQRTQKEQYRLSAEITQNGRKNDSSKESTKLLATALVQTTPQIHENPSTLPQNYQLPHQIEAVGNTVEQKIKEMQILPPADEDYNEQFEESKQKEVPQAQDLT